MVAVMPVSCNLREIQPEQSGNAKAGFGESPTLSAASKRKHEQAKQKSHTPKNTYTPASKLHERMPPV